MKKFILPALFVGAIAFGSTSCKKSYVCCTVDDATVCNPAQKMGKTQKAATEVSGYNCTKPTIVLSLLSAT